MSAKIEAYAVVREALLAFQNTLRAEDPHCDGSAPDQIVLVTERDPKDDSVSFEWDNSRNGDHDIVSREFRMSEILCEDPSVVVARHVQQRQAERVAKQQRAEAQYAAQERDTLARLKAKYPNS